MAASASRCRSTVAQSPRAAGPVRAARGPRAATSSTAARSEAGEGVEGQPGGGGHPLDLAQQRHHVVGRDAGGGVVGGPVAVGHLDHAPAEASATAPRHRVAGHGEGDARAAGGPAPTSPLGSGTSGWSEPRSGCGARTSSPSEPERWTTTVVATGSTAAATSATASSGVAMTSTSTPSAASPASVVVAPEEAGELVAPDRVERAASDGPARPGPMMRM